MTEQRGLACRRRPLSARTRAVAQRLRTLPISRPRAEASHRGPASWSSRRHCRRPGPRRYARLVHAAEAALSAGTAQLAKTLIDEIDKEVLDPVSRGRLIALGADYVLFTSTPAVVHGTEEMLAAATLFHGEDDELEQRSLIRAWECALPSERLTTGPTWTQLGERFLAGAAVREGPAATILRALSALVLLPYAEAVPILPSRAGLRSDGYGGAGRRRAEQLSVTTALMDLDAWHRCLERCGAAARMPVLYGSLDNVSGHCRCARRSAARRVGPLATWGGTRGRRAIGYDGEHVVNVATLAWDRPPATRCRLWQTDSGRGFRGVHVAALGSLATVDIASAYQDAYDKLKPMVEDPFFHVTPMMWPDFIEAAARRRPRRRCDGHRRPARRAGQSERFAVALGVAARSRASCRRNPRPSRTSGRAIEALADSRAAVDLVGHTSRTASGCGGAAAQGQRRTSSRCRRSLRHHRSGTVRPAHQPEARGDR